jgi:hypothetical protein
MAEATTGIMNTSLACTALISCGALSFTRCRCLSFGQAVSMPSEEVKRVSNATAASGVDEQYLEINPAIKHTIKMFRARWWQ